MSQEKRSEHNPPAGKGHLTATQIGGGIGAAAAVLVYFVIRDLSAKPGQAEGSYNFLLAGLLGGAGAVLGLAIGACVGRLRSTIPGDKTAPLPADAPRASVLGKVFAVLSLVCVPVLGFGLLFGISGLVLTRKPRGWPWVLSMVGTVLSAVVTVVVIVVIANIKK